MLARAEHAVAALSDGFVERIQRDLSETRARVDEIAQDPKEPEVKRLFGFAHDLRGQGGSFGYPLLTEIGGSLCHFLESREYRLEADDIAVLHAHLDAAAAIVSGAMAGEGDAVSQALIASLGALVQKRLTGQS